MSLLTQTYAFLVIKSCKDHILTIERGFLLCVIKTQITPDDVISSEDTSVMADKRVLRRRSIFVWPMAVMLYEDRSHTIRTLMLFLKGKEALNCFVLCETRQTNKTFGKLFHFHKIDGCSVCLLLESDEQGFRRIVNMRHIFVSLNYNCSDYSEVILISVILEKIGHVHINTSCIQLFQLTLSGESFKPTSQDRKAV